MNWTPATVVIMLLLAGYAIWFGQVARRRLAAPSLRPLPLTNRLRQLELDVLLLPLVIALAGHWDATGVLVPLLVAPAVALAFWTFAPRYVSSKVVPLALVADGLYGFVKLRDYLRAYGADGTWHPQFLLFEAWVLLAAGLWWTWRMTDPNSPISRLVRREKARCQASAAGQGGAFCCYWCWLWWSRCSARGSGSTPRGGASARR
jgi:hypothetical protein